MVSERAAKMLAIPRGAQIRLFDFRLCLVVWGCSEPEIKFWDRIGSSCDRKEIERVLRLVKRFEKKFG